MDQAAIASQQTTVACLFWGTALLMAADAYKEGGHKAKGLFMGAAVLAIFGFLVWPLWSVFPQVASVLGAIASAPTTWFMLFVAAYLILRMRRTPVGNPAQYDDSDLRNRVMAAEETVAALRETIATVDKKARDRLNVLEEQYAKVIDDYQRMTAAVDDLTEKYEGAKRWVEDLRAHVDKQADELAAQIGSNEQHAREQRQNIYLGLEAIYHRERLNALADQIESGAEALFTPSRDRTASMDEEAWQDWIRYENAWRGQLNEWCVIASLYEPGITAAVNRASKDDILGDESIRDDQLPSTDAVPNSAAVLMYKTASLAYREWGGLRNRVDTRVNQAAFTASAREMRGLGG